MESLLPSQTDPDIMGKFETIIDLWYGLQMAVRKFAEWTKSRMDFLTEFLVDTEFSSVAAVLQFAADAKVNSIALCTYCFCQYKCPSIHQLLNRNFLKQHCKFFFKPPSVCDCHCMKQKVGSLQCQVSFLKVRFIYWGKFAQGPIQTLPTWDTT